MFLLDFIILRKMVNWEKVLEWPHLPIGVKTVYSSGLASGLNIWKAYMWKRMCMSVNILEREPTNPRYLSENSTKCATYPVFGQCFHFLPPENTRKSKVFWCFQRVWKGNIGQKWVNDLMKFLLKNIKIWF